MRFDNRAADRQAQADSCLLCRKKCFEDVVDRFWRETAAAIAKVRNLTLESFSDQTTKNAERFFGF